MVTQQRGNGRANALKGELIVHLEETTTAPAEIVYDRLADVRNHLEWGGTMQPKDNFRLLSIDAPEGPALVGTEFQSTGADAMGRFADSSVVTEATRPSVFEFVTEARLSTKKGKVVEWTNIHRYELTPAGRGLSDRLHDPDRSPQRAAGRVGDVQGSGAPLARVEDVRLVRAEGAAQPGQARRGARGSAREGGVMKVGRIRTVAGIALAGALLLAVHAPVSSAGVAPTHIEVFNVEGPFEKDIDVGKPGFPTAGDYAVESQPLLDPSDGSSVGRSLTQLTIVRPVSKGQDVEIVLNSTLRLPDGDLALSGGLRFSELFARRHDPGRRRDGSVRRGAGTVAFAAGTVAGQDGFVLSIDITIG